MADPRVVIRADGSSSIGWGHIRRCLTLADALRDRGASVTFVTRALDGHPGPLLASRGYATQLLTVDASATWHDDAAATAAVVGASADWLVVDHYGLDARWEGAARGGARRVMVIDDLANRPHACDLLLDQNLVLAGEARYDAWLPAECGRLLGPQWALIAPAYADARLRMPTRSGVVQRVHVSFGGADVHNVTGRVLTALLAAGRGDLHIDVVVSAVSPHLPSLRALVADRPHVRVLTDVPDLVALLALADVAIGASGVTSWERLALGVPSLLLTLADNQRPIAEALHQRGVATWLGDAAQVSDEVLHDAARHLVHTPLDPAQSAACMALVDGRGARRTATAMMAGQDTTVRARDARITDEDGVLAWANDRETRRQAFSPEPIPLDTHQRWFRRRLRDLDGCEFYMIDTLDAVGVGQVRLERTTSDWWEVHYLVAPAFRGRGLGRAILDAGLQRFWQRRGPQPVLGRVKADNRASSRIFEGLGFTSMPAASDVLEFRKEGMTS